MTRPQRRVLLVEDDRNIRLTVRAVLESAGFEVVEASSGEEGLARCDGDRCDSVLLDVGLPGIDGLEVLRSLRRRGCSLPVIVMTADARVEIVVRAMKLGALDVLQKPFTPTDVRNAVERALSEAAAAASRDYDAEFAGAVAAATGLEATEAEARVERAWRLDPARPEAWNFLGGFAEVRGDRARALTYYRVALLLDPRYEPAERNLDRATSPSAAGHVWLTKDDFTREPSANRPATARAPGASRLAW